MKRTFRNCAVISGLIERRHPGQEKTGRQVTVSTDLIYDVLRTHEPDHILLQATRADAATGLLDIKRLGDMLARVKVICCTSRSTGFLRWHCLSCSKSGVSVWQAMVMKCCLKRPQTT